LEEVKKRDYTYGLLGDFSNIVGYPNTLRVFFEELLGSGSVHIMHKERVFCWNFCPQVLCHGIA
jgi:hypothetical protein